MCFYRSHWYNCQSIEIGPMVKRILTDVFVLVPATAPLKHCWPSYNPLLLKNFVSWSILYFCKFYLLELSCISNLYFEPCLWWLHWSTVIWFLFLADMSVFTFSILMHFYIYFWKIIEQNRLDCRWNQIDFL